MYHRTNRFFLHQCFGRKGKVKEAEEGGSEERLFVEVLIVRGDTLSLCVCVFDLINNSVWPGPMWDEGAKVWRLENEKQEESRERREERRARARTHTHDRWYSPWACVFLYIDSSAEWTDISQTNRGLPDVLRVHWEKTRVRLILQFTQYS